MSATVFPRCLIKAVAGEEIVLASSMIELTKGTSGDYVPYFVEDKEKQTTQADTADGEVISAPPKNIYNRKVTVKRYNAYSKTKNGTCQPTKTFKTNEVITGY